MHWLFMLEPRLNRKGTMLTPRPRKVSGASFQQQVRADNSSGTVEYKGSLPRVQWLKCPAGITDTPTAGLRDDSTSQREGGLGKQVRCSRNCLRTAYSNHDGKKIRQLQKLCMEKEKIFYKFQIVRDTQIPNPQIAESCSAKSISYLHRKDK